MRRIESKISLTMTIIAVVALLFATPLAAKQVRTTSPILTVQTQSTRVMLTREQLETLPTTKFTTQTPWTEGQTLFEGVRLSDVLVKAQVGGATLKAVALNDYASEMKLADVLPHALIAYKVNGEVLSVRTKGPLWIVFPFDDNPSLKNERYYSKSVWQLKSLVLID